MECGLLVKSGVRSKINLFEGDERSNLVLDTRFKFAMIFVLPDSAMDPETYELDSRAPIAHVSFSIHVLQFELIGF